MRRFLAAIAAVVVAAGLWVSVTSAAPGLMLGIYDEAQTLLAPDPVPGFNTLAALHTKVLRLNLYWNRVSPTRPKFVENPFDHAYDWSLYDRAIRLANERGIRVLLTIVATPAWANGGLGAKYAPTSDEGPAELCRRGGAPLLRSLLGDRLHGRRCSAPSRRSLDGLERAEQPDLSPAAVEASGRPVGGGQRGDLCGDLQRSLARRPQGWSSRRTSRSPLPVVRPHRGATTSCEASDRRSGPSVFCVA